MMTHEKFAVAAIVLAAAVYLVRLAVANHRKRRTEGTCEGCGCGKAIELTKRNSPPNLHQSPPASIRRSLGK